MSKNKVLQRYNTDLGILIYKLKSSTKKTMFLFSFICKRDFGSIFSILLHGKNDARLVPSSESNDILQGVDINVCLNETWKESLTELSGGQR